MATAETRLQKPEFVNEPFVDFGKPENRAAMEAALKKVAAQFGDEYPMYITGQTATSAQKKTSTNPSHPAQVLGTFQEASADQAKQAIESAHDYFDTWKRVPTEQRTEILFRAAAIIRARKFEISAWICYEVGKSWPEADADTAEPIDFLYEAGIPKKALQFLTGKGQVAGAALVKHPKTRFIAFTGSKEVGLMISEAAGKREQGQLWIKRAVLEMGGKDATIVDEDADLDAAVEGVALAAFGYQGQKCSACSRAIVSEKVYDSFVQKLVERTKKVSVGPAEDPSNYMGPVVSESAMDGILKYIEVGKKEGKLVAGGGRAPGDGYFVQPTVIADVDAKARVAQDEIFGPVLAVIKARDFDHALEIANGTEFGLTGAVYSKNKAKLEKAEETFHVGNLYLNRKCTGAMVGAHPFGGFNMSGTDSKTGGKDYLHHFLQAKSIAEKL